MQPENEPLRRAGSAARLAYDEIQRRMARGEINAGMRLREEALAESMGISRTPVREALRQLRSEGIVEITRHRGARVSNWNRGDIEEISELRSLLEGYGARIAARRIDEAGLGRLRDIESRYEKIVQLQPPGYVGRAAELNNGFHAEILHATGNSRLIGLLRGIVSVPLVRRTFAQYTLADLERSINHHRELIDAFSHGDAEWAETTMRAHIHSARYVLTSTGGAAGGESPAAPPLHEAMHAGSPFDEGQFDHNEQ